MALTQADIERFAALAGPDFAWNGVKGTSRPAADVRTQLRLWLVKAQDGICPVCGDDMAGRAVEFNHVVARGPMVKGFTSGNVFAGCASCNAATKPLYDETGALISGIEILPLFHFARPDVIPNEWPAFPYLRSLHREARARARATH